VKNTLSTVQSLVRRTLKDQDTPAEVERDITDRLMALSAAHDVLCRERWSGAGVAEIAGAVMGPYIHTGRVSIDGPAVRVSPRVAIALALGLQELATNAARRGALSGDAGRLQLSWTRGGDEVDLVWRESASPHPAPAPSGFGSVLLGRMLAVETGHPAQIDYAPDGLICRLRAPAAG
jgi:two-component sensor histidine kinase